MGLAGYTAFFGGSFNPPHIGHQMACLYLLEALNADEVWLAPCFQHPFGKDLAPYELRLEMCRLLAEPLGDRVVVSTIEQEVGGAGRTYDTLTNLIARFPQRRFALVVGADILGEVERWHRWSDIEAMVEVVVVGRGGFDRPKRAVFDLPEISSCEIRELLGRGEFVEGLLPASVASLIEARGLYSGS